MADEQNGDSVVLEEELDPDYAPTIDEQIDYGKWLGMSFPEDDDLLWIAREGLKAPLPEHWKPCRTLDTGEIYYFSFADGQSSWDHPCDSFYRNLCQEEKRNRNLRSRSQNNHRLNSDTGSEEQSETSSSSEEDEASTTPFVSLSQVNENGSEESTISQQRTAAPVTQAEDYLSSPQSDLSGNARNSLTANQNTEEVSSVDPGHLDDGVTHAKTVTVATTLDEIAQAEVTYAVPKQQQHAVFDLEKQQIETARAFHLMKNVDDKDDKGYARPLHRANSRLQHYLYVLAFLALVLCLCINYHRCIEI